MQSIVEAWMEIHLWDSVQFHSHMGEDCYFLPEQANFLAYW
jgi:hypothetical protein